jgi:hypothetical protein
MDMEAVECEIEEVQKFLPWFTEKDIKSPLDLRKMAAEYHREGEYFETNEPNEVNANKKYDTARSLELLATAIEKELP